MQPNWVLGVNAAITDHIRHAVQQSGRTLATPAILATAGNSSLLDIFALSTKWCPASVILVILARQALAINTMEGLPPPPTSSPSHAGPLNITRTPPLHTNPPISPPPLPTSPSTSHPSRLVVSEPATDPTLPSPPPSRVPHKNAIVWKWASLPTAYLTHFKNICSTSTTSGTNGRSCLSLLPHQTRSPRGNLAGPRPQKPKNEQHFWKQNSPRPSRRHVPYRNS